MVNFNKDRGDPAKDTRYIDLVKKLLKLGNESPGSQTYLKICKILDES